MDADKRLEDIATLARSALLAALPVEDIGSLLERLEVLVAPAGAALARPGDPAVAVCFLLEGRALEERAGLGPRELGPGDSFGELGACEHGDGATVSARTPVRVARLSRAALDALGQAHPAMALHFAMALLSRGSGARRVADAVPEQDDGALVVGARVNGVELPLHAPIAAGATVLPVTTRTWAGREIYRRAAGLALLEAARREGIGPIKLGPSITSGRVALLEGSHDLPAVSARLGAALHRLVAEDVPIRAELWPVDLAIAHFDASGWSDASALLGAWPEPTVALVRCGGVLALQPGTMLSGTGRLSGIEVLPHPLGILLDFGPAIRRELGAAPSSTRVIEMRAPRYGAEMTRRGREWLELLGTSSVGRFNQACVSGQVKELINVSEAYHEKRIALVADEVRARPGVRVIAVAGPSSSGKTTFIRRLKVQLLVDGLRPHELSLDDYYRDRDRSARDARGEHDFEALESLDLELLDEHVSRLLGGEPVRTARYDFHAGKSLRDGGPELRLGPTDVLLVEGIHALAPALLGERAGAQAFRIFVHPATSLQLDRLSSFEPADVRLLRRIVRDRHQRGFATAETLARWPSVRRGERLHIFPFQANADAVFDSSLVYEVSVLRVYAERYLLEVPRAHPEAPAAQRLRRLLAPFVPIHPDHVPPTSILREFIGGSGFSY